MREEKIAIAAGGTAGHLLPALSVAQRLVDLGLSSSNIVFVTSDRTIDAELMADTGFEVVVYRGTGLRSRSRHSLARVVLANIWASILLLPSLVKVRAEAVVGFGGYYSLPTIIICRLFGARVTLVEQNAVLGRANRMLVPFAHSLCTVVESGTFARRGLEVIYTGNPLRKEVKLLALDSDPKSYARSQLGVEEGVFLVVAAGGSLGARRLNELVIEMLPFLDARASARLCIHHVLGSLNNKQLPSAETDPPLTQVSYTAANYDARLFLWFAAADLVISRAGASTISEISALGRPSILLPLPNAPYDHQFKNAEVLAKGGGALVLREGDLDAPSLAGVVSGLMDDPDRLDTMSKAVAGLGKVDATESVADVVLGVHRTGWDSEGKKC